MANFNFGIDCQSVDDADGLLSYLDSLNLYMDGLDSEDERLSVISKQARSLWPRLGESHVRRPGHQSRTDKSWDGLVVSAL
jgi:hypothetical protein